MKILTWNINGIRAAKQPLKDLFDGLGADIICVQETKVTRVYSNLAWRNSLLSPTVYCRTQTHTPVPVVPKGSDHDIIGFEPTENMVEIRAPPPPALPLGSTAVDETSLRLTLGSAEGEPKKAWHSYFPKCCSRFSANAPNWATSFERIDIGHEVFAIGAVAQRLQCLGLLSDSFFGLRCRNCPHAEPPPFDMTCDGMMWWMAGGPRPLR